MTTTVDIAWAAGLFEGEGSISMNNGYVVLAVGMTDRDVVERFAQLFDLSITGPYRDKREGTKPVWVTRTQARDKIAAIYEAIGPMLGSRRKKQFAVALSQARAPERDFDRGVPPCGHTVPCSQSGRDRHIRRGEPVCDECRLAYNAYQRNWKLTTLTAD